MTKRITHKICKHCNREFIYSHRKQTFCNVKCSFFNKVEIPKDKHSCWGWPGSKHHFGYGDFRFDNTYYRAHIYSYDLFLGDRKHGDHVLHKCDNPSCCNPDHLFLGDQSANMRDMAKKERSGLRILTNKQVIEIKKLISFNFTQLAISSLYNISQSTVSAIKHGRLHKNVE